MTNALRLLLATVCALLAVPAFANCSVVSGNHEKTPDAGLTDNANGTITHTATSLIWKQCPQGLSGAGCATGTATTHTWQAALQQAVSDTTAGQTDWRLPSRNELLSIVESGCAQNMINITRFPNAPANAVFWTSTPAGEGNPTAAWAVRFSDGNQEADEKLTANYVRLVRSGTADQTFNQRSSLPATGPSNGFPLFTAATGQTVGTLATSNTVVLAGITGTVPLSIADGEYQISATATFANATDIITWTAHPLRVNDRVSFSNAGGALPTGITAGTLYYVIAGNLATNTFQISTTPGGTALNFTTDGTGTNTARLDWQGNTYTRASTVTFTNATDLVNLTAHGLAAGASVIFTNSGGALPTGITANTRYYVIAPTANAFQISTAPGGTFLNFTTDGTGTTTASITWPNATRNVGNWSIQIRALASSTGGTTNTATLTINYRATSFAVTTLEPTPVVIPAKTGVARSTVVESDPITVSGLTAQRAISISGGTAPQYRLSSNGGATWSAWTNVAGNISNNDLVQVRQTSSASASTATTTTLTINSQNSVFSVTTGLAVEPADMTFPAVTDAERGAFIVSAPATLSGLTATRAVTFTGTGSGAYSLSADNGVTWTAFSATGNVSAADNGKLIRLRATASTTASTLVTATLNINARAFNFAVTTGAALDYPDVGAGLGEAYNITAGSGTAISDAVTIGGLSTGTATISIAGTNATYSKNAAAYTAVAGTVVNGDQVTVRITPMPNCSYSPAVATLSINGYAFPFTAWTGAGPAGPTTFAGYTNITNAAQGSTIQSAAAPAVSGLAVSPSCISIRGEGNPEYQIGAGAWTNATATVANTNTIRVRLTTPNTSQQTSTLWLMINGVEYPFSVTTQ